MNFIAWKIPVERAQLWTNLSLVTLLIMEVTELSLWYQVIFQAVAVPWGVLFAILAGILLASHLMALSMDRMGWRLSTQQGIFIGWLFLAMFASLKLLVFPGIRIGLFDLLSQPVRYILNAGADGISFFHILGVALLIWRGVSSARVPVSLFGAQVSFQVGLVWMLIYGMVFAPLHPFEATFGLYLYLFCGLVSMSSARIAGLSELRGGRLPRFGWGWFTGMAAAALGVVALSIIGGWLASSQVVTFVVRVLAYVFGALTGLLLMVFTPVLMWLASFIPRLISLINQLFERLRGIQMPKIIGDIGEQLEKVFEYVVPAILASRGLFLAGILIIILLAVLLGLRLHERAQRKLEEEDASQASPEQVENLLRKLINRFLHNGRSLRLRSPGQMLAAARIRQIYRQLTGLSARLGAERPPSLTPLEFLPRMEAVFPGEREGLDTITFAYVKVRYGELPETLTEVEAVESAWNRLREQGRQSLSALKMRKKQDQP